jgi:uncharacterized protein YyaL (SSP411 family)
MLGLCLKNPKHFVGRNVISSYFCNKKKMIPEFKGINKEEFNQLREAIALITVLIAGADGKIDKDETDWAKKVTEIRSYSLPTGMKEFYKEVGRDFSELLDAYIAKYDGPTERRNQLIAEELAKLNEILSKIEDRRIASKLYKSYKSFAKHVAKSAGGVLGFLAINKEEKQWIDLPMITPVNYFINEEEEE